MYAKAQKARQLPPDAVLDADTEPFDELAIFGGKTHFIVSHSQTDKSKTQPPVAIPETIQVPPPQPAVEAPLPHLNAQQLDDFVSQLSTMPSATFHGVAVPASAQEQLNWESLYRELPSHPSQNLELDLAFPDLASSNSTESAGADIGSPRAATHGGAMLEDRWATFMNNYDFAVQNQYESNVAF